MHPQDPRSHKIIQHFSEREGEKGEMNKPCLDKMATPELETRCTSVYSVHSGCTENEQSSPAELEGGAAEAQPVHC